jgi:hypothetical protein
MLDICMWVWNESKKIYYKFIQLFYYNVVKCFASETFEKGKAIYLHINFCKYKF